jgi:hypothetical protein
MDLVGFARAIVDAATEEGGMDLEPQWVQETAEHFGLIYTRKPTERELADPEWWGHEYDMTADTLGVIVETPEFIAACKAAKTETV